MLGRRSANARCFRGCLYSCYIPRLRPLGCLLDFKLDLIALANGLEPVLVDCAVVNKHIPFTYAPDESKSPGVVKPLDCSFDCHFLRAPSSFFLKSIAEPCTPEPAGAQSPSRACLVAFACCPCASHVLKSLGSLGST